MPHGAVLRFRNTTGIGQDGRGNVALAVDGTSATGAPAATFEYTPFGEMVRATSQREPVFSAEIAGRIPFRYQNKYALWFDKLTTWQRFDKLVIAQRLGSELYDFGRRVYAPEQGLDKLALCDGRFISRDPIGHAGGLNLYAYVGNQVPNAWDFLEMVSYRYSNRTLWVYPALAGC